VTSANWFLVESAAQLLKRDEREAVLGDLAESGEGLWQGIAGVCGLVVRRHASLWRSWRPWLASFGLTLPCSFLLIGASVSVSWTIRGMMLAGVSEDKVWPLVGRTPLLFLVAWAMGFLAGSLSSRTLWASACLTLLPCLFCFSRFGQQALPSVILLVFLPPAVLGAWQGVRQIRVAHGTAMALAVASTALALSTLSSHGIWWLELAFLWPMWLLVAVMSRREACPV
jgi:hypothetical protein